MTEIKIGNDLKKLTFAKYIIQSGQPTKYTINDYSVYDDYYTQFETNKIDNGCFQDAKYWVEQQGITTKYYCSGYTDNFGELNYTVAYDNDNFNIDLKNISLNFFKKRYSDIQPEIKLSVTVNKETKEETKKLTYKDSSYSYYENILNINFSEIYKPQSNQSFSIKGEYTRNNSKAFREDTWIPITLDYQYDDKKDLLFYKTVKIGKATTEDQNNDSDASNNVSTVSIKPILPTPIQEGYIFKGWNTVSDNTGTTYNAGQEFSSETPTTLYAIWEKERNFTPYVKDGNTWKEAKAVYVNTNYGISPTPNWVEIKNVYQLKE